MLKTESKRVVLYSRVSSVSQIDGYSLDAQERLFHELCKNRGWTVVNIYREEGKSAHSDAIRKRPVFKRLLEDAANDKFDVVVVHTLPYWTLTGTSIVLANLRSGWYGGAATEKVTAGKAPRSAR